MKKLTAVRVKERDLVELERIAEKEDENVSFLIRQAIAEFIARYKAKVRKS
jgi:predicted transcriptional regulator